MVWEAGPEADGPSIPRLYHRPSLRLRRHPFPGLRPVKARPVLPPNIKNIGIILEPGAEFVLRTLLRVQDGTAVPAFLGPVEVVDDDEAKRWLILQFARAFGAPGIFVAGQYFRDFPEVFSITAVDLNDRFFLPGLIIRRGPAAFRRIGLGADAGCQEKENSEDGKTCVHTVRLMVV